MVDHHIFPLHMADRYSAKTPFLDLTTDATGLVLRSDGRLQVLPGKSVPQLGRPLAAYDMTLKVEVQNLKNSKLKNQ